MKNKGTLRKRSAFVLWSDFVLTTVDLERDSAITKQARMALTAYSVQNYSKILFKIFQPFLIDFLLISSDATRIKVKIVRHIFRDNRFR